MTLVGLLQNGRSIETLGTSQHRPPSGCEYGSSGTHFGLDAGRGSSTVYRKAPGCGQTLSREHLFYHRVVGHADSITSYPTSPKASAIFILAM